MFPTLEIQLTVGNRITPYYPFGHGNQSISKFLNLETDNGITLYQIPEYSDMFGKPEPGTDSICFVIEPGTVH